MLGTPCEKFNWFSWMETEIFMLKNVVYKTDFIVRNIILQHSIDLDDSLDSDDI